MRNLEIPLYMILHSFNAKIQRRKTNDIPAPSPMERVISFASAENHANPHQPSLHSSNMYMNTHTPVCTTKLPKRQSSSRKSSLMHSARATNVAEPDAEKRRGKRGNGRESERGEDKTMRNFGVNVPCT